MEAASLSRRRCVDIDLRETERYKGSDRDGVLVPMLGDSG